jgi:chromosomal replication initiation ATPase DnaA
MAHEVNQIAKEMISRVQSTLASSVGSARYDLWLARQTQWSFDQRTLTLRFTSEFAQQLCQKMLGKEIAAALLEVSGDNRCQIQYQVCADDQRCSEQCTDHQSASTFVDSQPEATIPISKTTQSGQCEARSSETRASVAGQSEPASTETGQTIDLWSQIVPGQSNQMACAALNLISAEPGKMTPLVIHGPTGTGKSMMLAALAQRGLDD